MGSYATGANSSVGRFDFPVANSDKSFTAEVKKVKIELAAPLYVATAQFLPGLEPLI